MLQNTSRRSVALFVTMSLVSFFATTTVSVSAIAQDSVLEEETSSSDEINSDEEDQTSSNEDDETSSNEDDGTSLFAIPAVAYSQETSLLFTIFASYTFPLPNTGEETWPSTITGALVYTLEKQASAAFWTSFYLGEQNDWAIDTENIIEHFPTHYYGIGMDSESSYQLFTRRRFQSNETVRHRVYKNLYFGIADHFSLYEVEDVEGPFDEDGEHTEDWTADDRLGSGNVLGEDDGTTHGIGFITRWDARDNAQSARRGILFDLELAHYASAIGSDTDFSQGTLDLRGYASIGDFTIATQWKTVLSDGDIPFLALAELGGDELLRGVFQGRFRDQNSSSAQLELRSYFYKRLGGVAFASAGQTFSSFDQLSENDPTWAVGGGLRYMIDTVSRSTIRLDYGIGPDGGGAIFTFGEAF